MANPVIQELKNKIKSGNPVTRLIIINVAVFLFTSLLQIIYHATGKNSAYGKLIESFVHSISFPLFLKTFLFSPWSIITSMFTHGEILHLFWNMISLFWFGKILSDYTSERKIIPLYILGGISGSILTFILINTIPAFSSHQSEFIIGASASVTAIIIAAATLVPNVKINLIFIGQVKLLYVALFVIFIDILNISMQSSLVGNLSHLGGTLIGYLFIVQYKKGVDMSKGINRFLDWLTGLFKTSPKSKMKVAYKRKVSDEEFNYNKKLEQEHVDKILDKISKSGYESLSKSEKEILFKTSGKK